MAPAKTTKKTTKKATAKKTTSRGRVTTSEPAQISSIADWKQGFDLPLPSGHMVRARKGSLDQFVQMGLLPNTLLEIIREALDEHKPPSQRSKQLKDLSEDEDKVQEMLDAFDDVLVYCVLEPKVTATPRDENGKRDLEAYDPEKLYPEEVELDDKIFIFQWAIGGTAKVEKFRKGSQEVVESIQSGKNVGRKTK